MRITKAEIFQVVLTNILQKSSGAVPEESSSRLMARNALQITQWMYDELDQVLGDRGPSSVAENAAIDSAMDRMRRR